MRCGASFNNTICPFGWCSKYNWCGVSKLHKSTHQIAYDAKKACQKKTKAPVKKVLVKKAPVKKVVVKKAPVKKAPVKKAAKKIVKKAPVKKAVHFLAPRLTFAPAVFLMALPALG